MCVYWTFKEFPSFFRHRSAGWLSFGYIRTVMLERLTGGMSYLAWRVLDVFFSQSSFSFSLGCRCVVQGRSIHIRAAFAGFLGDEKGLKEIANTKGASGSKPCPHCKNIVSKLTLREHGPHEYFATISAPSYGDLDLHSDETFWEMVDLLVRQAPCLAVSHLALRLRCALRSVGCVAASRVAAALRKGSERAFSTTASHESCVSHVALRTA